MNHRYRLNFNAPSIHQQRGMSMLGAVFAILLGAFALTCILKLGPAYMQNMQIQSILSSVKAEFDESDSAVDKRALRSKLQKLFDVNQINALDSQKIAIDRDGDEIVINGNYESRIELFSNVDVILKFEENEVRIAYYGNQ